MAVQLDDETYQLFSDSLDIHCHWASFQKEREPHSTHCETVLGYWMFLVAHRGTYAGLIANSDTFRAYSGQVVCIPPSTAFSLSFERHGALSGVALSATVLGGLDLLEFFTIPPVLGRSPSSPIADALSRFAEVAVTMHRWDFGKVALFNSLGYNFVAAVLDAVTLDADGHGRMRGALRLIPVVSHIWRNASRRITRAELASVLGVGEQHLHLLFKRHIGVAPYKYIQRVRLMKAQTQLISRQDTIGRIAEELGFCDQFHFSKEFKKEFGISPTVYRERKRAFLADMTG
jgi:AraC family transcriptional regulator